MQSPPAEVSTLFDTGNATNYLDKHSDIALVYDPQAGHIVYVCWASDRARKLLVAWGMQEGATGLSAELLDPSELFPMFPADWVASMVPVKEGLHVIQELALPAARGVVN